MKNQNTNPKTVWLFAFYQKAEILISNLGLPSFQNYKANLFFICNLISDILLHQQKHRQRQCTYCHSIMCNKETRVEIFRENKEHLFQTPTSEIINRHNMSYSL